MTSSTNARGLEIDGSGRNPTGTEDGRGTGSGPWPGPSGEAGAPCK